ncbi:MAG TPA: hypothetical protein VGV40_01250 [Solirubrobacteraceae bacterium]|nr:hypothetical protein [Solirubrobacteraceae bacterium]
MRPEEALSAARQAAACARARGGYPDDLARFQVEAPERPGIEQLLEWAVIEPDVTQLYSTRRLGAPITALKRALARAMAQYHVHVLAQQTRFNVHLAMEVVHLADRVTRLEERAMPGTLPGLGPPSAPHAPPR